jgi:hypothetical protein
MFPFGGHGFFEIIAHRMSPPSIYVGKAAVTAAQGWQKGQKLYHKGEWNRVEVIARGARMELKLNGETTIVVTDDKAASGVIALQLHRGEPMRVEFREIRIKPL